MGEEGAWNFTRTTDLREEVLFSTICSTLLSPIVVPNLEEHHMLYLQNLTKRHLQNASVGDHLSMNKTMKVCLGQVHRS